MLAYLYLQVTNLREQSRQAPSTWQAVRAVEAHTVVGATQAVPVQQAKHAGIGMMANATMAVPVRSTLRARAVPITATAPLVPVAARRQALARVVGPQLTLPRRHRHRLRPSLGPQLGVR